MRRAGRGAPVECVHAVLFPCSVFSAAERSGAAPAAPALPAPLDSASRWYAAVAACWFGHMAVTVTGQNGPGCPRVRKAGKQGMHKVPSVTRAAQGDSVAGNGKHTIDMPSFVRLKHWKVPLTIAVAVEDSRLRPASGMADMPEAAHAGPSLGGSGTPNHPGWTSGLVTASPVPCTALCGPCPGLYGSQPFEFHSGLPL